MKSCRAIAPRATVVATADDAAHAERLRAAGAGFVVQPYDLSGGRLARLVREWSAYGASVEQNGQGTGQSLTLADFVRHQERQTGRAAA